MNFAENTLAGLASLRGWRLVLPAFAWSLGVSLLQSLSFWVGFFAFGIDLPFQAALVTNATVAFAIAIPSAPGFVGHLPRGRPGRADQHLTAWLAPPRWGSPSGGIWGAFSPSRSSGCGTPGKSGSR